MSMPPMVSWPERGSRILSDAADGLLARARVEDLVGEHDQAGAGAVDGHARPHARAEGFHQAEEDGQLGDGGGLAAGDDEGVHLGELFGAPDRPGHGVCRGQGDEVLPYVALEGQDANDRSVHDSSEGFFRSFLRTREPGDYQPRLA
jgi:hypothetical protein